MTSKLISDMEIGDAFSIGGEDIFIKIDDYTEVFNMNYGWIDTFGNTDYEVLFNMKDLAKAINKKRGTE